MRLRTLLILVSSVAALAACNPNITAAGFEPVGRFALNHLRTANPGSQFLCGVDTTGLLSNDYDDVPDDGLVIGQRSTGADDRCKTDVLRRFNGYVGFDLSGLGTPPDAGRNRRITQALVTASIDRQTFVGGSIGCRTSVAGAGMLEAVYLRISESQFYIDEPISLANPPPTRTIPGIISSGRRLTIRQWFAERYEPLEILGKSPGAVSMRLNPADLSQLQDWVDNDAEALREVGLYFISVSGGSTGVNQTCIEHFNDIRLTVFYEETP